MGRGDFTKIPNGIPSIEDRVHLLYTHGVAAGRIPRARFVDLCAAPHASSACTRAKGVIAEGSDADMPPYPADRYSSCSRDSPADYLEVLEVLKEMYI